MHALPTTTPNHYLTGTSALSIPCDDTTYVDWHFVDSFINGRAQFRIVGVNFVDTTALLALRGVRECGEVLRRAGLPLLPTQMFYAANRDRAVLDLLLGNFAQGRRPDHLRLKDYFETEAELVDFHHQLDGLRPLLPDSQQRLLLDNWRAAQ